MLAPIPLYPSQVATGTEWVPPGSKRKEPQGLFFITFRTLSPDPAFWPAYTGDVRNTQSMIIAPNMKEKRSRLFIISPFAGYS